MRWSMGDKLRLKEDYKQILTKGEICEVLYFSESSEDVIYAVQFEDGFDIWLPHRILEKIE